MPQYFSNPTRYESHHKKVKVLVLGSGIAGLSCALKFAKKMPVTLVCKDLALEGATRYAQGGIASVWSKEDSFEAHIEDTLRAGAGLCDEEVVRICVNEGPARVRELVALGVPFTKQDGDPRKDFDLHREGGHGLRRILHADDLTGLALQRTLLDQVREDPRIELLEHHMAIDLITEGKLSQLWGKPGRCLGAYILDNQTGDITTYSSDCVVLATGGAGKVYLYTSNPDVATGDGVAMGFRAGARVANMEFFQFHPTCLYHPKAKNFLISEAVRGEGAILINEDGDDFMAEVHEMGSLAPRDIVARAIDSEIKRSGHPCVYLDTRSIGKTKFIEKFPNIYDVCKKFGIDPVHEPIPVVPAAHYCCGGIRTDLDGRTTIEGLYAVGEVASTGLHGANRLASNSLLEAVVFAHRVVEHASRWMDGLGAKSTAVVLPSWDVGPAVELEEQIDIAALWLEIRTLMWNYVGISRSQVRLSKAAKRLNMLQQEVNEHYWNHLITRDLLELRNIHLVAQLIVASAMQRKESRGLHYMSDYPKRNDLQFRSDTVV